MMRDEILVRQYYRFGSSSLLSDVLMLRLRLASFNALGLGALQRRGVEGVL